MNRKTVEVSNTDEIVLTQNGVVVGVVIVRPDSRGHIEFAGKAVNVRPYGYAQKTFNSFACGFNIIADDEKDVASFENFEKVSA